MKNEDRLFLKELQHQMLTQDNVGQASPRFWVVRDKVKVYGIELGYNVDGTEVIYDCEAIADSLKELYEYLKEHQEDIEIKYCTELNEVTIVEHDGEVTFDEMEELADYMVTELEYDDGLYCVNYREEYEIKEDTMFLTLEECKNHIECNRHHYKNPQSYAMTAWRSPQVKKLFEILENTNWDEIGK